MTDQTIPVFLTVKQVATRESVSVPTIHRWVREGRFPKAMKLGPNCSRWRVEVLEKWEESLKEVA